MIFKDKLFLSFAVKVNNVSMILPRITLPMMGLLMLVSVVEVVWEGRV